MVEDSKVDSEPKDKQEKKQKEEKSDIKQKKDYEVPMEDDYRILIGIYFLLLIPFFLYCIIRLWPASIEGNEIEEIEILILKMKYDLSMDLRFILLVFLTGGLGACIHIGSSFTYYVIQNKLYKNNWWWYILRPFIGSTIAVIFYFVFRGLLFTTTSGPEDINIYGILAIAGLVGMFSKQAVEKLRKVFDELLTKVKNIEEEENNKDKET
jgi:hypothetical protein